MKYAIGHGPGGRRKDGDDYEMDAATGCWNWRRQVSDSGYGVWQYRGLRMKAHRCAYIGFYGAVPEDWDVHHLCHNKLCVNPQHLQVLGHAEHAALSLRERRPPGPKRTERISLLFTPDERADLEALAGSRRLSSWCREFLLRESEAMLDAA